MTADQFNEVVVSFSRQVVPDEVAKLHRQVALEGLRRLVMKTPVDTGRARGGWQVGLNERPMGQTDAMDKGGGNTIQSGSSVISQIQPFSSCYLTNNVAYIVALEDGHSQQAPSGMLALTVEELKMLKVV